MRWGVRFFVLFFFVKEVLSVVKSVALLSHVH